jgi:hypothetical protein
MQREFDSLTPHRPDITLSGFQFRERGLKMYDALVSNPVFANLPDAAVVVLTYVGMATLLYLAVSIPFRLGKRASRNVNDPTDKIISDTSRSLTGTAFDPFALYGSPNLPGGANWK